MADETDFIRELMAREGLTEYAALARVEHNRTRIAETRTAIRERIAESDMEIAEHLRGSFGNVLPGYVSAEEFLAEDGTEEPPC